MASSDEGRRDSKHRKVRGKEIDDSGNGKYDRRGSIQGRERENEGDRERDGRDESRHKEKKRGRREYEDESDDSDPRRNKRNGRRKERERMKETGGAVASERVRDESVEKEKEEEEREVKEEDDTRDRKSRRRKESRRKKIKSGKHKRNKKDEISDDSRSGDGSDSEETETDLSSKSGSESESGSGDSESETNSEEERERERRHRKKKEKRKREKRREREKDKEKEERKKEKRNKKEKQKKEERKAAKKKKKEETMRGPITEFGKFGIIRETDMWVKRPEFSAWLSEVKKMNLEQLTGPEEKALFKDFMEDFNTGTMPSKKYYNLAMHQHRQLIKAGLRGAKLAKNKEMTEFNDEEMKREEVRVQRQIVKEEEVQRLKAAMQGGRAQDMIEQARLREEMQYHFRLGNFEEAAKIQKRLDPDVPVFK